MKKLWLLFCFSLYFFSYSQEVNKNFSEIDHLSESIKFSGNLPELVRNLTEKYTDETDKTRAIYSWILENIAYDYKSFNRGKKIFKFRCSSKKDCEAKLNSKETEYVDKILNKKKAICSGYSKLFKRMCDLSNIKCVEIEWFIKNSPYQVGNMGILDHAWNAVIINKKYYYLDLTWASGYCTHSKNGKLNGFVKHRNDFFWFTPIEKFSVDHFPKDSKKILDFEIKKEDYKNQPYIEKSIIPDIELINPKIGILHCKKNDTIQFEFKYPKNIQKIQINTNVYRNPKFWYFNDKEEKIFNEKAFKKQRYIPFEKVENIYRFQYKVDDQNLYYIEILFDYDLKLKYKVVVDK